MRRSPLLYVGLATGWLASAYLVFAVAELRSEDGPAQAPLDAMVLAAIVGFLLLFVAAVGTLLARTTVRRIGISGALCCFIPWAIAALVILVP